MPSIPKDVEELLRHPPRSIFAAWDEAKKCLRGPFILGPSRRDEDGTPEFLSIPLSAAHDCLDPQSLVDGSAGKLGQMYRVPGSMRWEADLPARPDPWQCYLVFRQSELKHIRDAIDRAMQVSRL